MSEIRDFILLVGSTPPGSSLTRGVTKVSISADRTYVCGTFSRWRFPANCDCSQPLESFPCDCRLMDVRFCKSCIPELIVAKALASTGHATCEGGPHEWMERDAFRGKWRLGEDALHRAVAEGSVKKAWLRNIIVPGHWGGVISETLCRIVKPAPFDRAVKEAATKREAAAELTRQRKDRLRKKMEDGGFTPHQVAQFHNEQARKILLSKAGYREEISGRALDFLSSGFEGPYNDGCRRIAPKATLGDRDASSSSPSFWATGQVDRRLRGAS